MTPEPWIHYLWYRDRALLAHQPTHQRSGIGHNGPVHERSLRLDEPLPRLIGFLLTTGTPVLSFLAAGLFLRGIPRWRRFGTWLLLLGSPLTLVLVVLFFLTFDQATTAAGNGVAGLTQRILALEVLAWFAAMGWLAFRRP